MSAATAQISRKNCHFIGISQSINSTYFLSKAEILALLDKVQDFTKNVGEDATRNERKKIREEKMADFKEKAEVILGPSFEGDRWRYDNKDDEKKDVTKMYGRVLSRVT